jgi:transcriptional/translational regulatory protein YebC/TACO1
MVDVGRGAPRADRAHGVRRARLIDALEQDDDVQRVFHTLA